MQQLVTGEAVAVDLRPARLPSRLLAGLIDAILQLLVFVVVGALAQQVGLSLSSAANSALTIVVVVLILIGLPVGFESLLRGRTPGKAALGLRVVRDDGGPIGFRQAFVRALAGAFLERPGITLFVGSLATMLLNDAGKRIGDLLAGTVVLQERVTQRGGPIAVMPLQLSSWAAQADLAGVTDGLALSVRQFLGRSAEFTDAAREEIGGRLVQSVLAAVSPPPPLGTPGWAVLSAVLAERRQRAEHRLATSPAAWGPTPAYGPPPVVPPAPEVPPLQPREQNRPPAIGPGGFVPPS